MPIMSDISQDPHSTLPVPQDAHPSASAPAVPGPSISKGTEILCFAAVIPCLAIIIYICSRILRGGSNRKKTETKHSASLTVKEDQVLEEGKSTVKGDIPESPKEAYHPKKESRIQDLRRYLATPPSSDPSKSSQQAVQNEPSASSPSSRPFANHRCSISIKTPPSPNSPNSRLASIGLRPLSLLSALRRDNVKAKLAVRGRSNTAHANLVHSPGSISEYDLRLWIVADSVVGAHPQALPLRARFPVKGHTLRSTDSRLVLDSGAEIPWYAPVDKGSADVVPTMARTNFGKTLASIHTKSTKSDKNRQSQRYPKNRGAIFTAIANADLAAKIPVALDRASSPQFAPTATATPASTPSVPSITSAPVPELTSSVAKSTSESLSAVSLRVRRWANHGLANSQTKNPITVDDVEMKQVSPSPGSSPKSSTDLSNPSITSTNSPSLIPRPAVPKTISTTTTVAIDATQIIVKTKADFQEERVPGLVTMLPYASPNTLSNFDGKIESGTKQAIPVERMRAHALKEQALKSPTPSPGRRRALKVVSNLGVNDPRPEYALRPRKKVSSVKRPGRYAYAAGAGAGVSVGVGADVDKVGGWGEGTRNARLRELRVRNVASTRATHGRNKENVDVTLARRNGAIPMNAF